MHPLRGGKVWLALVANVVHGWIHWNCANRYNRRLPPLNMHKMSFEYMVYPSSINKSVMARSKSPPEGIHSCHHANVIAQNNFRGCSTPSSIPSRCQHKPTRRIDI